MTITPQIYDTRTLLATMRQVEAPTTFWSNFFGNSITFDDEFVDFSKITENRKLAPLVVPTSQGRPIYSRSEKLYRVKPAYLKPRDPVSAAHQLRRTAGLNNGELLLSEPLSPQQRYEAIVADILRQHREAIERRWEWMAAEAILNGTITLTGDDYPTTTIDFERDSDHSVTLLTTARWSESTGTPIEDLEEWIGIMADAEFGGMATLAIMGTGAWNAFRGHADVREQMDTTYRNTSGTTLDLGIGNGALVQHKGRVSANLEVIVYNDYYHDTSGTLTRFMDSRDVLLIAPSALQGTKCFGAILDVGAGFQSMPIFPKMWHAEDPSATFILSQSAPLMVPVNPNATFKARVIS